ncbi:MAG: 16S rRNA (guanine(527)-N(7))-methyltransferase RsmG [Burkholderiaceae bacterium]|nr:16S rRNA (guanine(527)-N(7))-methyltransferase RsmG [Burkholderiaceae bacterium]MDO9090005.1 16S rRNA (guanine(527)-N(7))-methyltransferase RsmG [Burkholderiaceae bacterium]
MRQLEPALRRGLQALGLTLTDAQIGQCLDYLALLAKWGKVYNLTALREPGEMLTHHLFDSLAVIAPLRRQLQGMAARVLDVGSGAGLPGVVIAICCPELRVCCVDAVGKKAAFVQQAAVALKLPQLQGRHARVETLRDGDHDLICSRAFASLKDFTSWSAAALAPNGVWLAMKGKHPTEELSQLPSFVEVFHVEPLQVPDLEGERCLIWMRPVAAPEPQGNQ